MNKIIAPVQSDYIKSFRKKPDGLIEELEAYAKEHGVPILSWQSADFIEQLVLIKNPKVSLKERVMSKTITPAAKTPAAMATIAFFRLIPNMWAARAPEYAPVPGRGTATKKASPR